VRVDLFIFLLEIPSRNNMCEQQGWPRKKGEKAKAFGILTQSERKRRNTLSAANPESLP